MDNLKEPPVFTIRKMFEDKVNILAKSLSDMSISLVDSLSKLTNKIDNSINYSIKRENTIAKSISENISEQSKSHAKLTKTLEDTNLRLIEKIDKLIDKEDEAIKSVKDSVRISNIDELPKPLEQVKIGNFPEVQVVKLADKIEPPIINIKEKIINFPEVQKVKLIDEIKPPVINITEKKVEFPKVQKVELVKERVVEFPKLQKVAVEGKVEVDFPKEIKINNFEQIEKFIKPFPEEISIKNLPISKGKKLSKTASPSFYLPVRLTDGDRFIDSFGGQQVFSQNSSGNQSVSDTWITTSGIINTNSTLLLGSNDLRKFAVITNDSLNVVYLSFGQEAILHTGIRLNPSGGSYEIGKTNYFAGNIYGVATGSGSNVCVLEVKLNIPLK